MSIWRVGTSVLTLLAAGAIGSTVAGGGDPPPPPGDVHITQGTGESGMAATAAINWQPDLNVAPQQLLLQASVTGSGITEGGAGLFDPQAHELTWVWQIEKVGDAGWQNEVYSAPVRGFGNFYVKGVRYHKRTGMVFHDPGTYRIYVTCIRQSDGARATSAVIEHTVAAPNDVFSSAQTFVVSNDAVFTGAPANAGTFSTFAAAVLAARDAGVGRARVLIKRGTTGYGVANFSDADALLLNDVLVSTWGSGARPTFSGGHLANFNNPTTGQRHWRVSEINFVGTWDASTNTGSKHGNAAFLFFGSATEWHMTISQVDCLNTGEGWVSNVVAQVTNRVAISDSVCFGFNDSPALLNSGQSFVAIGCRAEPQENALSSLEGQGGGFGFRIDNPRWLLEVSQCDMFNRMGNSFDPNRVVQQMIRARSTGSGVDDGSHTNVDRCWIEGSGITLNNGGGGGSPVRQYTNNVSNCFICGSWSYFRNLIALEGTGLQVANCVLVMPPNRSQGPGADMSPGAFVDFGNGETPVQAGARDQPCRVMNNTFISFRDGGVLPNLFVGGSITATIVQSNNVRHQPFASSGAINAGAFVATELYPRKFRGYNADDRALIPTTVTPTHVVELSGASGTFSEGSSSGMSLTEITLTAPGTVTAKVAQRQTTGGVTRLWLYDVTGSISSGATVTVSSGGTGTAVAAMAPTSFLRRWQPTFAPGVDAGQPFARVGVLGGLQTTGFRGAWPQAV